MQVFVVIFLKLVKFHLRCTERFISYLTEKTDRLHYKTDRLHYKTDRLHYKTKPVNAA